MMMMIIIMIIIVVVPDAVRPTGAHLQTILYRLSVDSDR